MTHHHACRLLLVLGLVCAGVPFDRPARGAEIAYVRDAAGRVIELRVDDGRTVSFAYDANGNLLSRTVSGGGPRGLEFVLGDKVTGELTAGDVDPLRFHALADSVVTLAVTGGPGLRLRLVGPDGAGIDVAGATRVRRKGFEIRKLVVTRPMLGGARARRSSASRSWGPTPA